MLNPRGILKLQGTCSSKDRSRPGGRVADPGQAWLSNACCGVKNVQEMSGRQAPTELQSHREFVLIPGGMRSPCWVDTRSGSDTKHRSEVRVQRAQQESSWEGLQPSGGYHSTVQIGQGP